MIKYKNIYIINNRICNKYLYLVSMKIAYTFRITYKIVIFAAEAIGAIAPFTDNKIRSVLEKYSDDEVVEVAETCQLAIERMKWYEKYSSNDQVSPYNSVDPTPPSLEKDVKLLKAVLLNENESLFERYQAMFTLRNINTEESISALCEGKSCY